MSANKRMRRIQKTRQQQVSMMDFLNKVREMTNSVYAKVECGLTYSGHSGKTIKEFRCYTDETRAFFDGKTPDVCLEKLKARIEAPAPVKDTVEDVFVSTSDDLPF